MKCNSYNEFFEVIANKTRLSVIEVLNKSPMYVGEICRQLGEEQSKISHSLRRLHRCHFVEVKREGRRKVYSLNQKTIAPLLRIVSQHVQLYCTKRCWVNT